MTKTEAERIAAAIHEARPDWPVSSLMTHLSKIAAKPYRDVFVAMAWIAADPQTLTPGRLLEAGPWWKATQAQDATPIPVGTCPECKELRRDCLCLEGAVPMPEDFRAALHASRDTGRTERAATRSHQEKP